MAQIALVSYKMTAKSRTSKKPKPTRSETLGLRLDPRLKFALELLARDQRRSISGTVEWCVEQVLRQTHAEVALPGEWTFEELTMRLWNVDPNATTANICALAPRLATYEELQKFRVWSMTNALWRNLRNARDGQNLKDIEDPVGFAAIVQEILDSGKIRALNDEELERAGIDLSPF